MNWDALGAIGELIASVGVITSLVYLALQIREQSAQNREANHQTAVDEFVGRYADLRSSDSSAELYIRAITDFKNMSIEDRARADALFLKLMVGYYKVLRLRDSKMLEEGDFRPALAVLVRIMKSPGANAWWQQQKYQYPPQIRESLDNALEKNTEIDSDYDIWVEGKTELK